MSRFAPSAQQTPSPPVQSAIQLFAWCGALAFAASLIWFFYSYLVRFGSVVPNGPVASALAVDIALFTVFSAHHSVFAIENVKQRIHRLMPAPIERSLYTWIASLLFIGVCTCWRPVPGVLYALDGAWRYVGQVFQLASVLLMIRVSSAIDVLNLAGVRPALAAARNEPPELGPLETSGFYGLVRHPLYLAWLVFVFATPVMTGTRAAFAIISSAYLVIAIPWEERSLMRKFGEEYEVYRRKVRWRIVPGIY